MQDRLKIAIFLIDDDEHTRTMLDTLLSKNGIANYTIYSDPLQLLRDLHEGVQICVIDYNLNDEIYDGLLLMKAILTVNSYCKCIIMSGHEEAALIKDFLNAGAYKYITKGEKNFAENLVDYINLAIALIREAFTFYTTALQHIKGATERLKDVKNG
jgi:DNA-binding NtrC family response regulator